MIKSIHQQSVSQSSHPFSLIIWANSMINLPSLYFWEDSKACSYFHPRVVLQDSQKMSATAWRPVKRSLSSARPQPTLTTELKRYALPWLPWKDLEISSSWLARWARQWMQLYVRWQFSRYAWNVLTILIKCFEEQPFNGFHTRLLRCFWWRRGQMKRKVKNDGEVGGTG